LIAFLKAMEFTIHHQAVAVHFEVEDLDAIARRADRGHVLPRSRNCQT